jgi:hypothetical protein
MSAGPFISKTSPTVVLDHEPIPRTLEELRTNFEQLVQPKIVELITACVAQDMRVVVGVQLAPGLVQSMRAFTLEDMEPTLLAALGMLRPVDSLKDSIPHVLQVFKDHGQLAALAQALIEMDTTHD